MKQLVTFDLDGTLLNTIADLAMACNYALEKCQLPTHQPQEYNHMVGGGISKLIERALPESRRSQQDIELVRSHFIRYYNAHNCDLTRPYTGIRNLLMQLQQQGIKIAVASNKYQEATEKLVTHFFPDIQFSSVLGQREGIAVKPNPQIVFDILQSANISASNALYVGDSDVDILTAQNANVAIAAVTWGFRRAEELLQLSPDFMVNNTTELAQIILNE